ncbi:hypothetical protein GGS24DRAFT_197923 [Hypoxylon argillaceum]|nr:hypothetical protein GGS24DRAFT_197923 [Hypoxylon argillaceum]
MVKGGAVHDGLPPHKQRRSLSNFFRKVLPSNRAEQGGTVRANDITGDTDSAYIDLGMDPNELTEWNLARERSLGSQPSEVGAKSRHSRGRSWSIQRGRGRSRHDMNQPPQVAQPTPSLDLTRPPRLKPASRERQKRSQPITRDEVRNMLKVKEDARKQRRDLKESGDWLGVQGADPYSGEFAVLTPTSTVSSELTSPSTKKRLAELSLRQKTAKLAYQQAKLDEITEREMILLQKEQSKLEKIELAKDELRQQQQGYPTWNQHKRRWSSAAEPELSPIPQSIKSYKHEGSSDEVVAAPVPVRNFSRPSKSSEGSSIGQSKPVKLVSNFENTEPPKHDHGKSQSTDTILHTTPPNMEFPDMSKPNTKNLYPSVFPAADDAPAPEQKKEKHFLSKRRRRMTDPGKLMKRSNRFMTHSSAGKTEENLVSVCREPPPPIPRPQPRQEVRNHFLDLLIPDARLHLLPYPEQVAGMKNSPTRTEKHSPPVTATRPAESSHSEALNKPALRIATNLSDCLEPQISQHLAVSDAREATAISSQLKPRGSTKALPVSQRVIPIRNSSFQARLMPGPEVQIEIQNTSKGCHSINTGLSQDPLGRQDIQRQSTLRVSSEMGILDNCIDINTNERDLEDSVSIPIITITGSDPDPQSQLEGTQWCVDPPKDGESSTISKDETPLVIRSQSSERTLCNKLNGEREWDATTSFHPTTPQSDSRSFVVAHKILETDTTSTDLATSGVDSTPTIQHIQPTYQAPKNVPMKRTLRKLEGAAIANPSPQHHQSNPDQSAQAREGKTNGADLSHRRRDNGAQQRQEPSKHKEVMIQEAAQIAMQRSRAKEIVTRSRVPSRTPSPRTRGTREVTPAVPAIPSLRGRSGGIDVPFSRLCSDAQASSQSQQLGLHHKSPGRDAKKSYPGDRNTELENEKTAGEEGSHENSRSGAAMLFVLSLLVTVCMVWFGLACAWWVVVKPAFDQRSLLWRRRRRRETTWEDVGVFAAAGVFFVVGALMVAGGLRGWVWVALKF